MSKKSTKKDNTVITSDKYISESGIQGGKIIGEKLALGSFIIGIPLILIGLYGLFSMVFNLGFPQNNANIIMILVVISLGILLTIGGYNIYKTKN